MTNPIHQLLAWISAHLHWAGLAVLLVLCAE